MLPKRPRPSTPPQPSRTSPQVGAKSTSATALVHSVVGGGGLPVLPTVKSRVAQTVKDYILLFYGPSGVGKTKLVHDLADQVLFLSTDRGTRYLKTTRLECNSWTDFQNAVTALEQPNAPKYDMVCVDHLDDMANMAESTVLDDLEVESLTDESLPWGKGWKMFKRHIMDFVQRLLALNVGLVFICHDNEKEMTIRGIKKKRKVPAIGKSAWNIIVPIVDLGGYCGQVTVKRGDNKLEEVRILVTQPREDMWAKDRTVRRRPPSGQELLDGKAFIQTFTGDIDETQASTQGISIEDEVHTSVSDDPAPARPTGPSPSRPAGNGLQGRRSGSSTGSRGIAKPRLPR